jgi:hypothetical protein
MLLELKFGLPAASICLDVVITSRLVFGFESILCF